MARKGKSTLKDLNEFLQQQPSTLVDVDKPGVAPEQTAASEQLDVTTIVEAIKHLALSNKQSVTDLLYHVCKEALESEEDQTASALMLLNTVSYLQHADALMESLKTQ